LAGVDGGQAGGGVSQALGTLRVVFVVALAAGAPVAATTAAAVAFGARAAVATLGAGAPVAATTAAAAATLAGAGFAA